MQACPQKDNKRKESSQHARSYEEKIRQACRFSKKKHGHPVFLGHPVFVGCFLDFGVAADRPWLC